MRSLQQKVNSPQRTANGQVSDRLFPHKKRVPGAGCRILSRILRKGGKAQTPTPPVSTQHKPQPTSLNSAPGTGAQVLFLSSLQPCAPPPPGLPKSLISHPLLPCSPTPPRSADYFLAPAHTVLVSSDSGRAIARVGSGQFESVVKGHDFSRAVNRQFDRGFSPRGMVLFKLTTTHKLNLLMDQVPIRLTTGHGPLIASANITKQRIYI
jgi:hypothetical protein